MGSELKPERYIREADLERLLSYYTKLPLSRKGPQKYLLVYLAKSLGLRMTEAVHLRIEDLAELDERIISIRVAKKRQKVPGVMHRPIVRQRVASEVVETVKKYLRWAKLDPRKRRGWLFPSPQNKGNPISLKLAHNWFVNGIRACGLPHRTFHSLRHYRGFLVQRSTGDLTVTMRELRHSSPAITVTYTQLTPDEQLEQLDEIEQGARKRTKGPRTPSRGLGLGIQGFGPRKGR